MSEFVHLGCRSVMFWPRDRDRRECFLQACRAEVALQFVRHGSPVPEFGGPVAPLDVVEEIRKTPRLEEFDAEVHKGTRRGMYVGNVLWETLGWYQIDPDHGGLGARQRSLSRRLGKLMNVTAKTGESWWRELRPVAHLWAAHVDLCRQAKEAGQDMPPHPCPRSRFDNFLALAEAFRELGPTTVIKQGHAPVLPAGEAYTVFDDINAQCVNIVFERRVPR